jgi:uncharacterized protein YjbI with pentapeptide repeats
LIEVRIGAFKTGNKTIKQWRFVNRPYGVCNMANKEQLAILKQGVAAWNKWREENPDAEIDLRRAKLDGLDLNGANFRKADIRGASFKNALLKQANFRYALSGSAPFGEMIQGILSVAAFVMLIALSGLLILSGSISLLLLISFVWTHEYDPGDVSLFAGAVCCTFLSIVFLERLIEKIDSVYFGTDFTGCNLTEAFFDCAYIECTRFDSAELTRTSWLKAEFIRAVSYDDTILADSGIRKLLAHGKGEGVSYKGKNMRGAYLAYADLRRSDLRGTDLVQANLRNANITGAKIWNIKREDWIIDGIRCDYIYSDEAGEIRTNFLPGEFEEQYKQNNKSSDKENHLQQQFSK